MSSEYHNHDEPTFRLEELDELLREVNDADRQAFTKYLEGEGDLRTSVRQHEEEMQSTCEAFLQAHVQQAEHIGSLYSQFNECEERLVDFEKEILTFQKNLEETSTDIANMQMQTDVLVRSVNNRRQVSNKINEVYTALQECDSFCEEISNKEVDRSYLNNLRELDRKIFFLSTNKALQRSAVDNEIRPKLTVAAQKAGDKLKRYLSKQIALLAQEGANIEENQQYLKQTAQFAYRFLQLYNTPVAREILKQYVRSMSEVYLNQFKDSLRVFMECSALHAQPLDALVTSDEAFEIVCNRDSAAGRDNQVASPPLRFPARTLARRERSVSQHMVGMNSGTGAAESLRALRAGTFDDIGKVLNSLCVRHGKLQPDTKAAAQLDQCNSWVWQFTRCFHTLMNRCVEECRFVGSFFCVSSEIEGGEDYNDAEQIARAVLEKAISAAMLSIESDLPMVMDRVAVLAALRVTDIFKQYLCTFLDPIPLMLLSEALEVTKASLKGTLATIEQNDQLALDYLPQLRLCPFRRSFAANTTSAQIVENKAMAAALGPHPLLYRIGEVLGQLEWLNNAVYRSGAFAGAAAQPTRVYDSPTNTFLLKALASLLDFTLAVSKRNTGALPQCVFASVNIYCTLSSWHMLAVRNPLIKDSGDVVILPETLNGCVAAETHARLLTTRLQESLTEWAQTDLLSSRTVFADVLKLVSASDDELVSAQAVASVVDAFASAWRTQWKPLRDGAVNVVNATLGSARNARNGSIVDERCAELSAMLLRCYSAVIVDANTKLRTLAAGQSVSSSAEVQSKLLATSELAEALV